MTRSRLAFVVAAVLCLPGSAIVHAQGVTGAAIQGRVLGPNDVPIEDATILVTNTSNGARWQTASHARGRYYLEQLSIGGPYHVEVRAVGFAPAQRDGVFLGLGQRLTADFTLEAAAYQLGAITVNARSQSRPYVVAVIGNKDTLPARFAETTSGQAWLDLQREVGLRLKITPESSLRLPAAEVSLRYANQKKPGGAS